MSIQKQMWTLISLDLNSDQNFLVIEGEEHHYAFHVLRLKAGDEIEVTNGQGLKALATVLNSHKKSISLQINKVTKQEKRLPPVHLWLASPKPSTLEEVVSNASELGVDAIFVFRSERSATKAPFKKEKLRKISHEAMRVSKSAFASEVFCFENLDEFYKELMLHKKNEYFKRMILFCDESSIYNGKIQNSLTHALMSKEIKEINEFCLLIGPEASFSDSERTFFKKKLDYTSVSLGKNILRVPTAVTCAAGILLNFFS